jgi:hypothetical protein
MGKAVAALICGKGGPFDELPLYARYFSHTYYIIKGMGFHWLTLS